MALQMLWMHWRTVRFGLLPLALAAFGLPLLVVQQVGVSEPVQGAAYVLSAAEAFLPLFPGLAATVGFTLALTAWSWDHKLGHVYALSLPISRARYALLKFGAGAVLVLVPVACFVLGGLIATAAIQLPDGLRAQPLELGARFLFASLLLYSLAFAMAAGTMRATIAVLCVAIGTPVLWTVGLELLGSSHPLVQRLPLVSEAFEQLVVGFGPFRVLMGNWMLIDA